MINENRLTAKNIKWNVPSILHKYDILIWIDTKALKIINNNIPIDKIYDLFSPPNQNKLFFWKHPVRTIPTEEIKVTIDWKLENPSEARNFGLKFVDFIGIGGSRSRFSGCTLQLLDTRG